jgi:hypothetical protein
MNFMIITWGFSLLGVAGAAKSRRPQIKKAVTPSQQEYILRRRLLVVVDLEPEVLPAEDTRVTTVFETDFICPVHPKPPIRSSEQVRLG